MILFYILFQLLVFMYSLLTFYHEGKTYIDIILIPMD